MKKYKLIKTYPGSPKLGTEVSKAKHYNHYNFNGGNFNEAIEPSIIKNNPEYWKEVIEKDYEILEIKGYSGHYLLQKDGSFQFKGKLYGDQKSNCYADKYLNSEFPHYIYSVKRLS